MNILDFSKDIAEIIDNLSAKSSENKSEDFLSPENVITSNKKTKSHELLPEPYFKTAKKQNLDSDIKSNQIKSNRNLLDISKGT